MQVKYKKIKWQRFINSKGQIIKSKISAILSFKGLNRKEIEEALAGVLLLWLVLITSR